MSIPGSASPLFFQTAAAADTAANIIKSVRFNSADSAYLNRTPSSAGSNTTWTLSTWVKKTGNDNHIFGAGAGNTPGRFGFGFNGSDKIFAFIIASNSTVFSITTDAVFRDSSAWYHLVLVADTGNSTQADRFKIYVNGVLQSVSGTLMPSSQNTFVNTTAAHTFGRRSYTASDYFNGYLASTILVDGTAKDETDFGAFDDNGVWQATGYSGSFGTNGFHLFDFANESGIGNDSSGNDNDFTVNNFVASSNNWANYVYAGGATYSSTETGKDFYTGSGDDLFDGTTDNYVGAENVAEGTLYFRPETAITNVTSIQLYGAYGAETRVNGSVVTVSPAWTTSDQYVTIQSPPSSITEISVKGSSGAAARLKAIKVNGSMLTDSPAKDVDVLRDVPTNGDSSDDTGAGGELSSNYCVWNPIDKNSECALANGNLEASPSTGSWSNVRGTIGVSSGKWYWEIKIDSLFAQMVGVATNSDDLDNWFGGVANQGAVMKEDGQVWVNQSSVTDLGSFAAGDIIGIGLDLDGNTIQFYKNGSSMGSAVSITGGRTYFPIAILYGSSDKQIANFGQRAFAYGNAGTNRPAATFKALCTSNLPTPTIADGSDYFDTTLYTGNGSTQTISGLEFSPDFVWIKSRGGLAGGSHQLYDQVRGATKRLRTNGTDAEVTQSTGLTAFTSDGFTVGNNSSSNYNNDPYVVWAWDAGSSTVSNTDGSVTSQIRVNQTAGFSIVSWTSSNSSNGTYDSIGHGLNASPGLVITKRRNATDNWYTAHGFDLTQFGDLNTTDAFSNAGTAWGNGITSSVIGMRIGNFVAANEAMIAYCFAPVAGYSAFGSYTGNGNADGPFVFTGHLPRFVIIKRTDASGNDWQLYDTARSTFNEMDDKLKANTSGAEVVEHPIDFLSNGFKPRNTANGSNGSGATYIYASFASNPFKAARAR